MTKIATIEQIRRIGQQFEEDAVREAEQKLKVIACPRCEDPLPRREEDGHEVIICECACGWRSTELEGPKRIPRDNRP